MNKIKSQAVIGVLGICSIVFFALQTPVAEAKAVVRSGETVSISDEQTVEGDFYVAAGKINISGAVEEDLIAAGGQTTINGTVGANALLLGGQVDVHAPVGDDLRIIAGEATIAEPVAGDVLVIGGSVNILSTATIAGDVLVYAGEVTIEGAVDGNVVGAVGTLRIDAPITGDVDVTVDQLTLGDRATVAGSVRYVSDKVLIKSLNASVAGDELRSDPVLPGHQTSIYSSLVPLLILLFSVLVWYLISRRTMQLVTKRATAKTLRSLLLGLATVFVAPIAIVILLASVIGTLVGLIGVSAYFMLLMLGMVGAAAVLGHVIVIGFGKNVTHISLMTLLVGVMAISLCMLLPILGQFIFFIFMALTIGAIVDLLLHPTLLEN